MFDLAQLTVFRLFQYSADKFSAPKDALIKILLLPSSSQAQHLRPPALAADKPSPGQFPEMTLCNTLPHKTAIFPEGFAPGASPLRLNCFRIHPGILSPADDCLMTAPGITIQLRYRLDDSSPDWIEMDIADKRQKVVVFIAQDGFVSVLKQVAGATMAPVEILRVPGEDFPHDTGNAGLSTLEKKMHMIGHKDPSVYCAVPFPNIQSKAFKKQTPILIVNEDIRLVYAPNHYMVQCARGIESGLSWHEGILWE